MSAKYQLIEWLIFLLGKVLGTGQKMKHTLMGGMVNSVSNNFKLRNLEQVKCWSQMGSTWLL
jgi:hypothetical protein